MACEHIKFPDGTTAIICGTRSRKQYCACGHPCEFLCDWKVPARKSGACDKPICGRHAQQVGPEKHLCPEHQQAYEAWKARHPSESPVEPAQPTLFERQS